MAYCSLLLIVCLALSAWLFFSGKTVQYRKSEEGHAEGEAGHGESEKRKEV